MTQSEPNIFRMTLMALYLLLVAGLICILIAEWLTDVMGLNTVAQTLLTILAIFAGLFFFLIRASQVFRPDSIPTNATAYI